jgi:transcriptional regulator with XRE-family HTH domain
MGRIHKHGSRAVGSPLSVHIGSVLLSLRQKHQVTMRQVADGAGLSNAFVCQVENGQSSPTIDTLWKLATFFQCKPGVFFDGYSDSDNEVQPS